MNWIPDVFRRQKLYDDLAEEMRLHIEERTEQLIGEGVGRKEAEQQARKAFGNRTSIEERSREVWHWPTIESIWADIRFASRQLRRSPGFTMTAVLTLALAIGANSVVFSVLNAFILRPLNVPNAESLYAVFRETNNASQSYPDYRDLRDRNSSFESLIAYNVITAGLDTGGIASSSWIYEVSGNYFDGLSLRPYLGRFFHEADEHGPNSAPYMVLTYPFWKAHFQADRGVVGRVVLLNKHPFTILGVAPPGFRGTLLFFQPDFFTPLVNHGQVGPNDLNARSDRWIFMSLGHLKPGVTTAQAVADLSSVGTYLTKTYPKDEGKMTFTLNRPGLYGDYLGRPVRQFLTSLMLLAGLILVGACANLGSLFSARAADRSREVALRLALGSSRKRILRGLFTEAILISIAGATVGLSVSVALLHGLSAWQPFSHWPLQLSVDPDAKVYCVALLLALMSGLLFGAVPVRQVLRTTPYEVVKAGSSGIITGSTGRRINFRDVLLIVQIAICAVLVTASMVAVRGLTRSMHNDFGFDVQNTTLLTTDLRMAGYNDQQTPAMQKRIVEALEAIPGVESVGFSDTVPLGDGATDSNVFAENVSDLKPMNAAADAIIYNVSPEYFKAARTALLLGRAFTGHDDKTSPRVAVVNRPFARKVFGPTATGIVGRAFKMPDGSRVQIVGVAEDGKYTGLTGDPEPVMFLPILQFPSSSTSLTVRSPRDPQQLNAALQTAFHQLDASLPIHVESRYKALDPMLFAPRMATISLGVLGVLGAMLSLTGIFGMAAYSVSKRLRELGIRVALGAQRKEVLQAALGRPLKLLVFGSVSGLILGVLASRVLAYIVDQATPRDPFVLTGAVLAMGLLGLVATWIPARRALSLNPLALLRED